jgi:hypothetical protein
MLNKTNMKRILFGLFLALFATVSANAQLVVSGNIDINGTTTWTNNNIYILQGFVKLTAGDTLVIQPGTVIKGDFTTKGSLIIERDAYIVAEGTMQQPIVFTSQKAVGQRAYGDWGGLIICGRGAVNQPANATNGTEAGEAIVEGGVGSIYGGGASPEENDNSGILRFVRIEFGGIPFQPNSEINGLTLCGVGAGTTIDHVQVSFCGDDAFEWFGGSVNAKNLVSYRNWDDDFDTDFGYHGHVQYGLVVRDPQIADQSGSNGFESDNDAQGTTNTPNTQPVFSNITVVGPLTFNSTINSNYKRALHLRRNTRCSVFNSIFVGYPIGLMIESTSTQGNATNDLLRFRNNTLVQMSDTLFANTTSGLSSVENNVNGSFNLTNWFGSFNNGIANSSADVLFNSISLTNPEFTLNAASAFNTGASFTDSYLQNEHFNTVDFRGAFGSEDWTSCWTNYDPQNTPYNAATDNAFNTTISSTDDLSMCEGSSATLVASSQSTDVTHVWSNGSSASEITVNAAGDYSVIATNGMGCTSVSNTLSIVVNELPSVSITADGPTSFCTGGSVVISSSQSEGNIWSNDQTSSSITVSQSGTYSVDYTDANGCEATSNIISVNVSDSPVPTISASGSTTICDGSSVTLTSSVGESYEWRFNNNVIGNNSNSIDATSEGLYTVTVTNSNACDGVGESDAILVSVNPSPTADASYNQTFGSYSVQFLNNSINATSYSWDFGDGQTSTQANPVHTYANGGDYVVTLTAINGDCEDVMTIELGSVSVQEMDNSAVLNVYPNPANEQLTIAASNVEGNITVRFFSLTGQLVKNEVINHTNGSFLQSINLNDVSEGMYLVEVLGEKGLLQATRVVVRK